jgi:hypothetical protein
MRKRLLCAALLTGIVAVAVTVRPTAQAPTAAFHVVGDLPGGGALTVVRDVTRVDGVIYAVGGAVTRIACSLPACPLPSGTDTPFLWRFDGTNATMQALPDIDPFPSATNTLNGAWDITPDARYIASQARKSNGSGGIALRAVRVDTSLLPSATANLNLNATQLPELNINTAAVTTSSDGTILYANGGNRAIRFDSTGTTNSFIPLLVRNGVTDTANTVAFRGASADGSVVVGSSINSTGNSRAFRYVQSTGISTEIPPLPNGTFNNGMAVSPDGDLVLAAGQNPAHGTVEVYLYRASTGVIEQLGTPNGASTWGPGARICANGACTTVGRPLVGGMTADGSVVAMNFGGPDGQFAYFRNQYGWFHLTSAFRANGIDLAVDGWDPGSLAITGMSSDATLVFGSGAQNGVVKGFIAEFAAGTLAGFNPQPAAPASSALIGVWTFVDPDAPPPSDPNHVEVFTASGTYYQFEKEPGGSRNGFERGNYSYDGSALGITTLIDSNGSAGLADINGSTLPITVSGDTLISNGQVVAYRINDSPGSIVGGWLGSNAIDGLNSIAVVFTENKIFNVFEFPDDSDSDIGTYTWDPVTHELVATFGGQVDGGNFVALTRDELGLHVVGNGGEEFDLTRVVAHSTVVPSITNTTLEAGGTEGSAFSFTVTATNTLNFEASVLPTGLSIDPSTGVISGTPAVYGTFNVTITVTNTFGDTDSATLTLTFAPAVTFRGIGDLPGGGVGSTVRDATRVNGTIYAVGASTVNHNPAAPTIPNQDTPVVWTHTGSGTLQALPNLGSFTSTQTGSITAYAITPDGTYLASQAHAANTSGTDWVRVTRSQVPNLTANLNLSQMPSYPAFAELALSDNGSVNYGWAFDLANPGGRRFPVRYQVGLGYNFPDLTPTGKTYGFPIPRGTSADGLVMVGAASDGQIVSTPLPPYGLGTNAVAFRYVHTAGTLTGTTTVIPKLPNGGRWNIPVALSSTGATTVVIGDSVDYPAGEAYLTDATNVITATLGSPNRALMPLALGGMTADGSVVAVTFGAFLGGQNQISGLGIPAGSKYAYIHNSHGWFHFSSVLAARGVDLVAQGWDPTNMAITGVRTVEGVDLVFGQGRRRTLGLTGTGYVNGALEGFVAELPAGVLAAFNPMPTPPTDQSIVGTWLVGDPTNPQVVINFLADGSFMRINVGATIGFERGLYTWAGNAAGGAITFTTLYDTDGTLGGSLRNGQLGTTQIVTGDTFTFGDTNCPACTFAIGTRITGSAGSIVGGWIAGTPALPDNTFTIAFLDNAAGLKYFAAFDNPGTSDDGAEAGTYTWDPVTHELIATVGGVVDPGNFVTLSRDELGLHLINDDGDEGDLIRVIAPSTVVPVITTPLTANATVSEAFEYTIPATRALTFQTSALPDGLSLDSATGVISGTPTTSGTFDVDVTVTNTFGDTANASLTINIRRTQAQLNVGAPASATYGSSFGLTLGGGNGTGVFSFELSGGCTATGFDITMTSGTVACTITAHRAGDDEYWEASATQVVGALKKPASVTPAAASKVYGTSDPSLTGSLSGFLAGDGITAAYSRAPGEDVAGSPYVISAVLSPAGLLNNYDITYNTASFTITRANSITGIASTGPSTYGQLVTFTATVTSLRGVPLPDGSVTFTEGGVTLATRALNASGIATFDTTTLGAGLHTVTATFNGSANYNGGSNLTSLSTAAANTTTALSSSPNPASPGQPVTFVATVTGQYNGLVTGTVTFVKGQQTLGTATVQPNGTATLFLSTLGSGSTVVTARYSGDANDSASTSPSVTQDVVAPSAPTTTTLTSSQNPSIVGRSVTLTARVTSGTAGTITGIVEFRRGQTVLSRAPLSNGQAIYTTPTLPEGSLGLTAIYSGDALFITSTSAVLNQVVTKATTTTTLTSSPNPSNGNQLVTLAATIASGTPGNVTGTVTFMRGQTVLGTASVSGSTAAMTIATLPAGSSNLNAIYSGDATYVGSTSPIITHVVNTATSTTSLTATPNPSNVGQLVRFTATVVTSTGAVPTGLVSLKEGSTTLATATLDASGVARLDVSTLPAGRHNLKAVYSGDAYTFTSTSNTYTHTVR